MRQFSDTFLNRKMIDRAAFAGTSRAAVEDRCRFETLSEYLQFLSFWLPALSLLCPLRFLPMVPAAAPPHPQWFSPASPGETPWAERGPRRETTWIPPRQGWAGEPVGRARTLALIGRRRSKHPERWGGAGSGRRRRRLRRFRRFLELESEAQVPWAW